MGNCLVKKLKSSVDNDNLAKLGILRIPVTSLSNASAFVFKHKAGGDLCVANVYSSTGELLRTYNSSPDNIANVYLYFPKVDDRCIVEITNKYNYVLISGLSIVAGTGIDASIIEGVPSAQDYKYIPNSYVLWGYDSMENWGVLRKLPINTEMQKGDLLDFINKRKVVGETEGSISNFNWYNDSGSKYRHSAVTFNGVRVNSGTSPSAPEYKTVLGWDNNKAWLLLTYTLYTKGLSDDEIAQLRTEEPYTVANNVVKTD